MPRRLHHIDTLKVVASNLIVLHHFTAYGPLADALDLAAPRLTDWFYEYARMAVQIFLVIGGYFAASALAPHGTLQHKQPWRLVLNRYFRLVPPLAVALLLVGLSGTAVAPWLPAAFFPVAPTLEQVLAHLTLLNGVLGFDSLSIGIWYVAIDFQLFLLLTILMALGGLQARWFVGVGLVASLLYFNLHEGGDNWAPYFFGAYGMGAVAWWAGHSRHPGKWMLALTAIGIAALMWDFRIRLGLALVTALILGFARWGQRANSISYVLPTPQRDIVRLLGRSAYALFLTHFAVWILANGLWVWLDWSFTGSAMALALLAWLVCLGVGIGFERYVERPLGHLRIAA